ncbi:hypothetical protein TWF506_011017 [Arthrobotrys conoides]|uniref:Uncharacterized protein n=1 Tax=Arthrobotrys conoides TaxID=74498 RepID=A0AAN8N5P3_9PEZI
MHIPLSTLLLLPLTSALVITDPKIFARKKNGWCDTRGIDRYVNNLPKLASSSVKSWCAAQTAVANGTVNFFATVTVTDDKGGRRVTKTRTTKTGTKTWTRYKKTKTVTVKKGSKTTATSMSTTPALAARQIATAILFSESALIGEYPMKRSNHNNNNEKETETENENFPVLDYSKSVNPLRGTPSNWTNLPEQLIQVLCDCLDSPWKTKSGTWTKTGHHTRTWTKTGTKTGGTTTVDVEGTTTKTVDSSGEATVTVTAN